MFPASLSNRTNCPLLMALLMPGLALAHPEGHETADLWVGFMHPLTGVDHALAMMAVGVWAIQLGRSARWLLPALFPLAMIGGALLARAGVSLPAMESMLALSVMSFGVAVALGVRMPLLASALLVSLFAVFHGHAHFSEAPAGAVELHYAAGFIAATVLLHVIGAALGARVTAGSSPLAVLRVGGTVIAATGTWLLIG
jgi:urease accessory protein